MGKSSYGRYRMRILEEETHNILKTTEQQNTKNILDTVLVPEFSQAKR
ncbi:hypothetical protein NIES4103_03660 [Nostoc sp. NIES-4103]|nr:hypothetical protein NIES4103_03660 [Nostoc sp. NIES-4103]